MKLFNTPISVPVLLVMLQLLGCGGGASHAAKINVNTPFAISNSIRGSISVYSVVNGMKGALLDSAPTNSKGSYKFNIENYSGVVLIGFTGGTYLDLATNTRVVNSNTVWSAVKISSDVTSADNSASSSITPLTDAVVIIASEMSGGLTEENLRVTRKQVISKLGFDPISILPTNPLVISSITARDAEKAYGAYLGALFQYQNDNQAKNLTDAISDFAGAINQTDLIRTSLLFKSINNYLKGSNNHTGLVSVLDLENLSKNLGGAIFSPTPATGVLSNNVHVIQTENAKTAVQGASGAWRINNDAVNHEIEGYASAVSINRGGAIDFFVNTIDPTFTISIFRMGWYGGLGGRLVQGPITLLGGMQPVCPLDAETGMIECNWAISYTLVVPNNPLDPTDWASGIYLAKLTGSSGKEKWIIFVVRDDSHSSDFLFQASVTTWQAYNLWGGKSHYTSQVGSYQTAYKVSFNRPYVSNGGAGDFMKYEIEMLRFMEKEGYDVTYSTNIDTHISGNRLLNHKAFLSVGHDEYWTKQMRDNVEGARDAGVNLGFFGANAAFYQIRLEPSFIKGSQPNRTIVAYGNLLSPTLDPVFGIHPQFSTMTFRSQEVNRPEAALIGVMYDYNPVNLDMVISDCTGFVCLGTELVSGSRLPLMLGYEVDRIDISSPSNIQVIANSPYNVCHNPPNCLQNEIRYSSVTYYLAGSGAGVFATGSMQWNWGLHLMGSRVGFPNPEVQQMTRNVLNNFAGK